MKKGEYTVDKLLDDVKAFWHAVADDVDRGIENWKKYVEHRGDALTLRPPARIGARRRATDPITSLLDSVADYWTTCPRVSWGAQRHVHRLGRVRRRDGVLDAGRPDGRRRAARRRVAATGRRASPEPDEVIVDVPVDPAQVRRDHAHLRGPAAIGFGDQYKIPAAMVQIGAPVLKRTARRPCRDSVFRQRRQVRASRTIVYEGTITAPPSQRIRGSPSCGCPSRRSSPPPASELRTRDQDASSWFARRRIRREAREPNAHFRASTDDGDVRRPRRVH